MNDDIGRFLRPDPAAAPLPDLGAIRRRGEARRRRRVAAIVSGGVAAAVVGGLVIARLGGGEIAGDAEPIPPAAGSPSASRDEGAPSVTASVRPARMGPIRVEVSAVTTAGDDEPEVWRQHELRFTNTGEHAVTVYDYRVATMLPSGEDRRLLAADGGCGYGIRDDGTAEAGPCSLLQADLAIPPGETVVRDVNLWIELPGMEPLEAGTYVHEREIVFGAGTERQQASVTIEYDVR